MLVSVLLAQWQKRIIMRIYGESSATDMVTYQQGVVTEFRQGRLENAGHMNR